MCLVLRWHEVPEGFKKSPTLILKGNVLHDWQWNAQRELIFSEQKNSPKSETISAKVVSI